MVDKGASLNQELPLQAKVYHRKIKPTATNLLCVLRYLPSLEYYCQQLLDQPLKGKRRIFQFLLYGYLPTQHMRTASWQSAKQHASTNACIGLKGLINAILRSFNVNKLSLKKKRSKFRFANLTTLVGLSNKLLRLPDSWQEIQKRISYKPYVVTGQPS